jgi:hypothetical protein
MQGAVNGAFVLIAWLLRHEQGTCGSTNRLGHNGACHLHEATCTGSRAFTGQPLRDNAVLEESWIVLTLHLVQLTADFLQATLLALISLVVCVATLGHAGIICKQCRQLGALEAALTLGIVLLLCGTCQGCLSILELALKI